MERIFSSPAIKDMIKVEDNVSHEGDNGES